MEFKISVQEFFSIFIILKHSGMIHLTFKAKTN
jgi:hypothetical protein